MPQFSVAFSSSVEADLDDIAEWYSQQKVENLTHYFWEQLQTTIHQLESSPKSGLVWLHPEIRRIPISKFPYHLYYDVMESNAIVRILAIIHNRRSLPFIQAKISQVRS